MKDKRMTVRLDEVQYERCKYWSEKKGVSINAYIADAIDLQIRYENKDYDIPTMEVVRLNQLVDCVVRLEKKIAYMDERLTNGFKSLIGLTRGDNYLNDVDEDI